MTAADLAIAILGPPLVAAVLLLIVARKYLRRRV
jgi:hypothetical protein